MKEENKLANMAVKVFPEGKPETEWKLIRKRYQRVKQQLVLGVSLRQILIIVFPSSFNLC